MTVCSALAVAVVVAIGAGGSGGAGLSYGRQWLCGARATESSSVRARSSRVSLLVMAVAVATTAARVTQGFAMGGIK